VTEYVGSGRGSDVAYVAVKTGTKAAATIGAGALAASQAGAVTGAAVGTAMSTGPAASAVAGLLSAAGVSSSVPVAGWIVAGGLVLAAGITATVQAVKGKNVRQAEMVKIGQQMGFPQAAFISDFMIKALSWGPQRRQLEGKQLEQKLTRGRGRKWVNQSKLAFIGVLEAYDLAEQRSAAGLRAVPPSSQDVERLRTRSVKVQEAIAKDYSTRYVGVVLVGFVALSGALLIIRSRD